jgi:DNA-binding PadR family transcriptional regulator
MNQSKITNAELAILSLVAEQPVHGYQIEQIIIERGMREWTEIGFSSIYYLLNKLEKKGWIKSQMQNAIHQGPTRRVFTATSAGLQTCKLETLAALSEPRTSPNHFQMGLANLPLLDKSEIFNALKHYEDFLIRKNEELNYKKNSYGISIPRHVIALFDHSQHSIEGELRWVHEFMLQYN